MQFRIPLTRITVSMGRQRWRPFGVRWTTWPKGFNLSSRYLTLTLQRGPVSLYMRVAGVWFEVGGRERFPRVRTPRWMGLRSYVDTLDNRVENLEYEVEWTDDTMIELSQRVLALESALEAHGIAVDSEPYRFSQMSFWDDEDEREERFADYGDVIPADSLK